MSLLTPLGASGPWKPGRRTSLMTLRSWPATITSPFVNPSLRSLTHLTKPWRRRLHRLHRRFLRPGRTSSPRISPASSPGRPNRYQRRLRSTARMKDLITVVLSPAKAHSGGSLQFLKVPDPPLYCPFPRDGSHRLPLTARIRHSTDTPFQGLIATLDPSIQ